MHSLFAFFGSCELLNDNALLPNSDLFASLFHQPCETARQFVDAMRLPSCNGFGGNQFCANADGGRARQNEVSRGLLIHAARRNQRNLWQGSVQGLDVLVPTDWTARKDFDEISPALHAVTTSVGVKAPGKTVTFCLAANSTIAGLKDGARDKTHARIDAHTRQSGIEHGARANDELRIGTNRWAINSTAPGTVIVISTIGIPPRVTASAAKCASSPDETLMAGMMAISRIREQTSSFVIVIPLHSYQVPPVLKEHYTFAVRFRQSIIATREPGVQRRQQDDTDEQVRNEAANDDDGKRSLRVRSDAMGERRGQQAQGCDQHGHHDRSKPKHRAFHGSFFNVVPAGPKLIDVFHHDHADLYRHAKQRKEANS